MNLWVRFTFCRSAACRLPLNAYRISVLSRHKEIESGQRFVLLLLNIIILLGFFVFDFRERMGNLKGQQTTCRI
jgi:hypothetical protein